MEKKFTFKVPSGVGYGVGNLIRQMSIGGLKAWAPVAFNFGGNANIQNSPFTVEDTQQLIASIKSLKFVAKTEVRSYKVLNFKVDKTMKLSELSTPEFDVVASPDYDFIHVLGDNVLDIKIILLNSTGDRNEAENREFLVSLGVNLEGFIVTTSSHSEVEKCMVEVLPDRTSMHKDSEVINITLESLTKDPETLIKSSMESIISIYHNMQSQ